ncbi:unnamed protein product [Didymodactylos carnosus]|uniref:Uncharacterized protein n=1 Tax=Didymodactylos carnosus TaxID=1234261 RepID=A0A814T582_9BILA|nr:unnamed protein product [Didymodactylos carnosus]CAF3920207.1 unnamed protein product [Didymodactylos carnosus]
MLRPWLDDITCVTRGSQCSHQKHMLYKYAGFIHSERTEELMNECYELIEESNRKNVKILGVKGIELLIYGQCSELFSIHAHLHLYQQANAHSGLVFHSMFSSESILNYLSKFAYENIGLGEQIVYWYTIDIQQQVKTSYPLFERNEFPVDNLTDANLLIDYKKEFRLACLKYFSDDIISNKKIFSRFQRGLEIFHSLSYRNRQQSASYCVSVRNLNCFNSIILDKLYRFVHSAVDEYVVLPCSFIRKKCIFINQDLDSLLCTEIEYELEHD